MVKKNVWCRGLRAIYTACMPDTQLHLTDALTWLDSRSDVMIKETITWANINTHFYNTGGLDELRAILKERLQRTFPRAASLEEPVLDPHHIVDAGGNIVELPLANCLTAAVRPDAPLQIFFCIHMDTVFPKDSPFQNVQWIDERTLNGPGVSDAKGGICIMLHALEAYERSVSERGDAARIGWRLFLNSDEELGSPSSAPVLQRYAQGADFGLLFEPCLPDGHYVGARKGSGTFTFVIRGRAAHVGREFDRGRSALHLAADLIRDFTALNDDPDIIANVGKIDGGGPVNVVADLAVLRTNVRVENEETLAIAEQKLRKIAEKFNAADGFTVELHGSFLSPPKPLSGRIPRLLDYLRACAAEEGLELQAKPSGGVCDGNRLYAVDIPAVDTLGAHGGHIHSDQEYLHVDSLTQRARILARLLFKLENGEIEWPAQ